MSFRAFRDAVIADIRAELVVNIQAGALNRPFLEVQPAPIRVDETWLAHVVRRVPSVHVAFAGSARRLERLSTGQFTGQWTMIGHVIAGARDALKSEAALLDRLYDFATWVEGRNFGFAGAGPAQVVEIENLWDIDVDKQGYSLGAVAWAQDVAFGRDLLAEAFLKGQPMFDLVLPPAMPAPAVVLAENPDGVTTQLHPMPLPAEWPPA